MVIMADEYGTEIRVLKHAGYDFEVGDSENSFEITFLRPEWEEIPARARIFIPGTEYGGIFKSLSTDTAQNTISAGGLTWRGMLQKKIIVPEEGEDYAVDYGELNAIVKARVEAAFPGTMYGTSETTGVSVDWQYARYCTLYDGLRDMLASVGYRLDLAYTNGLVFVQAVPIVNYSDTVDFSGDMRLNYTMQMETDGVNHLICLGAGELKDRLVRHLYVNNRGKITTRQYYFGSNEIAEVYDNSGASESDLLRGGRQRLKELRNKNQFGIKIDTDLDIAIGDIVGGRDYLSGMTMSAPVIGKVVQWSGGFQTIDYKLDEAGASE